MNTIRSVGYGWAFLCVAGGGAYYFAKRSVNADRAERAIADEQRRQQRERLRVVETMTRESKLGVPASGVKAKGRAPNANSDPTHDSAPVEHPPHEPSQFEASQPFRSRKGDRFS